MEITPGRRGSEKENWSKEDWAKAIEDWTEEDWAKVSDVWDTPCDNPGAEGYRLIVAGDEQREYILHTPSSHDGRAPLQLVINFHGFGGCAAQYANYVRSQAGLNTLADRHNFLVAYPQADFRDEKGDRYWDPGDTGEKALTNDVHFTARLIADVVKDQAVDPARVYAAGYSNGGMMAYGLACSHCRLIAGAAIMSGVMLGDTCAPDVHTPIIHFHGVDDGAVPYDGRGEFPAMRDVIDFWVAQKVFHNQTGK